MQAVRILGLTALERQFPTFSEVSFALGARIAAVLSGYAVIFLNKSSKS